ncbi:hypothetical protein Droror1_Dr00014184 [Drosera rotundifolia]
MSNDSIPLVVLGGLFAHKHSLTLLILMILTYNMIDSASFRVFVSKEEYIKLLQKKEKFVSNLIGREKILGPHFVHNASPITCETDDAVTTMKMTKRASIVLRQPPENTTLMKYM